MKSYNDSWISKNYNKYPDCYVIYNDDVSDIEEIIHVDNLDPKRYVMEFGQYAGQTLEDIEDENYLKWLQANKVEPLLQACLKIKLKYYAN